MKALPVLAGLLVLGVTARAQFEPIPLFTWEGGTDNWIANPNAGVSSSVDASVNGVTEGTGSLEITQSAGGWNLPAFGTFDGGTPGAMAIRDAIADGIDKYLLTCDVTFLTSGIPANATWMQMGLVFNSDTGQGGAWSQVDKVAVWDGNGDHTVTARWPLSTWTIATDGWYQIYVIMNCDGGTAAPFTLYLDNLRLEKTGGISEETIYSFEDGTTQGWMLTNDAPFLELDAQMANATDGVYSMVTTFNEGGWSFGAIASGVSFPAIDDGLLFRMDLHIPGGQPPINQIVLAFQEPDGINWQQQDLWIGGSSGNYTLEMPYRRTGSGPTQLFLGRATPGDVGERTVYVDNIRVVKALPLIIERTAPFRITNVQFDDILSELVITWNSIPGRTYDIEVSLDGSFWEPEVEGIVADGESASGSFGVFEGETTFLRVSERPRDP